MSKSRMPVTGCAVCVKWTTLALSMLLLVIGVFFIAIGAMIYNSLRFVVGFTDAVPTGADVMMLLGIAIAVISVIGLIGSVQENYCQITTFAILIVVVFVLQIAAAVAGFVISQEVYSELPIIMNGTISMYEDDLNQIDNTWDMTQSTGNCCGLNGPTDWAGSIGNNSFTVPDSCCINFSQGCGYNVLANANFTQYIYPNGCLPWLENSLAYGALVIAICAMVFSLVEMTSVICACLLARAIQVEYNML